MGAASGSVLVSVIACKSSSTCQRLTPISYFRSGPRSGLLGAVAVILLFAAFVGRIVYLGYRFAIEKREFEAYCCFGFALIFAGQALNMGVSSGLLLPKD